MLKWTIRILGVILILFLTGAVVAYYNIRDRHPGYKVEIDHSTTVPGPIKAGFSAVKITPEVPDEWVDANKDAVYDPDDGDEFVDKDGNGRFDAVWIAGFQKRRPATGIHDDLWARAMVIDDGEFRLALVVLDAIGFMHDDVIKVRERLYDELKIGYCAIMATHVHQAPDLIGLWGKGDYTSGVDEDYRAEVINGAVEAVERAVASLEPVQLRIGTDPAGALPLVSDTRDPQVLDPGLRSIQSVSEQTGEVTGTLVVWANHPETLWNDNLLISSDFPHFLRKSVEEGIMDGDSLMIEGAGGICIYANGAIGGLMTTPPEQEIRGVTGNTFSEPSYDKAREQGEALARLVLESLHDPGVILDSGALEVKARTIILPLHNKLFRLGAVLGVLDRGLTGLWELRSEIAFWGLGPVSSVHIPGEVYPEIINGGIEHPPGADFNMDPIEVPPVREIMPGSIKFIFGLSNDLTGYIIPKSEWDEEPPFLYNADRSPYGEINSLGPETAPIIYNEIRKMLVEDGR